MKRVVPSVNLSPATIINAYLSFRMNARMNANLNLIPFAVAILLVFTLLVSTQMSRAQSAVNGYVTDATTGETLIGASV
ncbi:MAG: hypothetical protein ACO363_02585, partial [Balneolaceae bacterium]